MKSSQSGSTCCRWIRRKLVRASKLCHSTISRALQLLRDPGFLCDALLTDVVLQHERGTEWLHECRQLRPEARIVVMSGYSPDVDAARRVYESKARFLAKPFSLEELNRALNGPGLAPISARNRSEKCRSIVSVPEGEDCPAAVPPSGLQRGLTATDADGHDLANCSAAEPRRSLYFGGCH